MRLSTSVKLACLGLASALATTAFGAGFQLTEMSAKKLGQANAGAAAYGDDASTVFWNPAGLRKLEERQFSVNAAVVSINSEFDRTLATDALGAPLSGNNGGDITEPAPIPAAFYAVPGDNFSWGIGLHVPFGLATEYDSDSIFRYQAELSEVQVLDINPALAWSNDSGNLHFGVGADIQHMQVELTSTVDYGAACFGQVGAVNPALIPSLCVANGLVPQLSDGRSKVDGDSWSFGYNFGVMWDASKDLTLGLSHRSSVDHDLEGDAVFTNAPAFFTGQGVFVDSDIEAEFESPSLTMLSAKWDVNPHWTIAADYSFSTWSNFEELNIDYNDAVSAQPNTVEPFEWEDSNRYSLGVEYKHSDQWTFRTGVAYDQSPINETERGARLPSASRTWLSLGTSYTLASGSSVDLGYTHLFLDDPIPFNRTGPLGDTIIGQYEADVDIVSFQYTHKF